MEFITHIREEILQKSKYEMAKLMELKDTKAWIDFEDRKEAVNVKKLLKLWKISGISAEQLLELMEEEFLSDGV